MRGSLFRSILLLLMAGVIAFPLIQDLTHILKPMPLKGAIREPQYARLTWQGWWSGAYQDTMGIYAREKTGIRPDLTRLINQIDYSLFNKTHANTVVIGKDGYLFEETYIKSYCGENAMPYDWWLATLYKQKMVQDTLDKLGIKMISIHAASKGSFYPEYFPSDRRCDVQPTSNHEMVDRIGDSLGIRMIDFNHWFVSMKGKTEGHLFTRQGTHWSVYGATMAADSFVRYIRYTTGCNLPDMKWDKGQPVLMARETDKDIFDGLNLMQRPDRDSFYYPTISYEGRERDKPKMIFIGDSFMWRWMSIYLPQNISTDWEFWYYNNDVFTASDNVVKMENYDWVKQLLETKYLVLVYSDGNVIYYGSGFIDKAYAYFYGD